VYAGGSGSPAPLAPSGQSRLDSSEAFSSRNVVVDGDLRLDIQIALAGRAWYEQGVKLVVDCSSGLVATWLGPAFTPPRTRVSNRRP